MEAAPMASLPPQATRPPPPPPPLPGSALRCPRCDSANTKFCYYNNYSRAQPRHFCRACRRHWTNGGTLRNVPVGGRRKAKRTKSSTAADRPSSSVPNSTASAVVDATKLRTADGSSFAAAVGPPSQPPVLPPPPPFGHLLHAPPTPPALPGYTHTGDDIGSSFLSALLPLPPAPHFGSTGWLTSTLTVVGDDRGYTRAPSSLLFPSQLSFTTPEDIIAGSAEDAISMAAPYWDSLPPPSSCGSCPGGDTAVLEPCSPSSCFWGSCWDDLTGVLFPHPTHASPSPPPPLPPPKQDLQLS